MNWSTSYQESFTASALSWFLLGVTASHQGTSLLPAATATSEGYLIFSSRPRLGLAVTLAKLKIGALISPEQSASWPSGRVCSLSIFWGQCPACLVRKRNSQVPSAHPPDLRSQIPDIPIPGRGRLFRFLSRASHFLSFLPPLTVMAEVPIPQVSSPPALLWQVEIGFLIPFLWLRTRQMLRSSVI